MAVYTEVSTKEARALLRQLKLGELKAMQGCAGGIENTNYFVSTERDGETHDYVLTLFERLTFEQLPFYLRLMKHLAEHGIPVPDPTANARGELVFEVKEPLVKEIAPQLKKIMETVHQFDVPIVVDVKAGSNWQEMSPVIY